MKKLGGLLLAGVAVTVLTGLVTSATYAAPGDSANSAQGSSVMTEFDPFSLMTYTVQSESATGLTTLAVDDRPPIRVPFRPPLRSPFRPPLF